MKSAEIMVALSKTDFNYRHIDRCGLLYTLTDVEPRVIQALRGSL